MEQIFGTSLLTKSGETIETTAALQGKVTGIYFSAHWCPPCRGFTPKLAEYYANIKNNGKPFEIVFVSSDKDEAAFSEYYGEMPWLALPFSDRDRKAELSSKYKVRGIPTLVLIDETGKTLSTDGRTILTNDPTGEEFPWTPKTLKELLDGDLRKNDGSMVPSSSLEGKNLALYFSAHWCPPCRGFTPKLAEVYNAIKATGREDVEFVFISSDRDEASFNEYHGEQPWLALPYDKRKEKEQLSSMFNVEGIPSLITLDPQGNIINPSARGAASEENAVSSFPWKPLPMMELSKTVECNGFDVNEKPSFILFCDGADASVKQSCSDTLNAVAEEINNALQSGEEPKFLFFTAKEHEGPVPQVKKLLSLPEELVTTPMVVILDIPDQGGFYIDKPAEITIDTIKESIRKYNDKELTRSQLKRG
jgi:nucleoredoxin